MSPLKTSSQAQTLEPAAPVTAPPTSRHLSLSPSRAADFKACPLRYRLRVVDRLPEPPSPAAARGTLVHAVLEQLFELPPAARTLAAAAEMLPAAWDALRTQQPELAELFATAGGITTNGPEPAASEAAWLVGAAGLLANYFGLEDPTRLQPLAREEYVETTLGNGLVLRGVIDRLDASPSGALRVVDYKTGAAPSEAWEAKALFQLKFYALVLWRTRGVVPAVLQLLYLADRQRLTYSPDEAELVAFERQLVALWQAIETALVSGDFRARRSALCGWCHHQARCPAFGGTPPPYPDLAGEIALLASASMAASPAPQSGEPA